MKEWQGEEAIGGAAQSLLVVKKIRGINRECSVRVDMRQDFLQTCQGRRDGREYSKYLLASLIPEQK